MIPILQMRVSNMDTVTQLPVVKWPSWNMMRNGHNDSNTDSSMF